jgi:hypothetical protein
MGNRLVSDPLRKWERNDRVNGGSGVRFVPGVNRDARAESTVRVCSRELFPK